MAQNRKAAIRSLQLFCGKKELSFDELTTEFVSQFKKLDHSQRSQRVHRSFVHQSDQCHIHCSCQSWYRPRTPTTERHQVHHANQARASDTHRRGLTPYALCQPLPFHPPILCSRLLPLLHLWPWHQLHRHGLHQEERRQRPLAHLHLPSSQSRKYHHSLGHRHAGNCQSLSFHNRLSAPHSQVQPRRNSPLRHSSSA